MSKLFISPLIRDCPGWRREPRPLEGAAQHPQHLQQGQWGPRPHDSYSNDRSGYAFALPPAPLSLRGRAMSENDLHFDGSHRWSPSIGATTLSEVEEGAGRVRAGEAPGGARSNRKKTPPPPRPPPPKWGQFQRRRASHHALLSSAIPAPHSVPHSSQHLALPEASRQRSYSLPPERPEVTQACPRCSCSCGHAQEHPPSPGHNQPQLQEVHSRLFPASPTFSRRAFKPVAPPSGEREPVSRPEDQQERAELIPEDVGR